jgi:hypothetical protein
LRQRVGVLGAQGVDGAVLPERRQLFAQCLQLGGVGGRGLGLKSLDRGA